MVAPHERHLEEKVEGPSNRGFGYTVGGILLAFAAVRLWFVGYFTVLTTSLTLVGAILVFFAAVAPAVLERPNRLWMALGLLLFKIVNPVIMLAIYITTFVPIGLIQQWRGYDPLAYKAGRARDSYWISRSPSQVDAKTMRNQF
ncbi:SxtJ family membrane protein [Nitratireductor sp. GCM10026969]|uniref:SxtJ family membrane protein n=1 Tax=Nitratireductor sp. GCM10026969 TaxID=3252645 RepID=UPI00362342F0